MEVFCPRPLRASAFVWQPPEGAFSLAVVCKATFSLTPGESACHDEPVDVFPADVHYEDDPRHSVAFASDWAPVKSRAEVLVTGHAFAPGGRAVSSLVARVVFRDIDKAVAVVGDSFVALSSALSETLPFTRMPLRWERASAGPAGQNPMGVRMGRDARTDAWGRVALPNFRPPGGRAPTRWEALPAVGLGAIPPTFPARLSRLPRRHTAWDPRKVLSFPMPPDFDPAFFNAAPEDQLTDEMTGDEPLVLENLLPSTSRLVTQLARVRPRAQAELAGGQKAAVDLRCDTLTVDTDRESATLVWRGNVPLEHPGQVARVVVAEQALSSQVAVPVTVSTPLVTAAADEPRPSPPAPPIPPIRPAPPDALKGKGETLKSVSPPVFSDYPIEWCARVAARIDAQPADKVRLLEKENVTPAEWEFLFAHWQREIRRSSARGITALAAAYDAAYAAELEAARRPSPALSAADE